MLKGDGLRILYLRTFREIKSDHALVANLVEAVSGLGRLVIVGPAEDEASLRKYWRRTYGEDADLDSCVEYIISSDDEWRREIHWQISRAHCILFYLAPKGSIFPRIQAPKMRKGSFEEFYSAPLHDGSTGRGLLQEIVYLRRLNKIRQTIVLCTSKDFGYIKRVLDMAPVIGYDADMAPLLSGHQFERTPKGPQAIAPRFSAFDKQMVSLLAAHSVVPFSIGKISDPARSEFAQRLRPLIQQVVRGQKWRRIIWRQGRWRPDALLGKSSQPRRLPPDNARKVIQFTNVEELLYIPRYEIADVPLTEIWSTLAEEARRGCPSCGAPLQRIFFFVRGLRKKPDHIIKGRCQQCFEPMRVEGDALIWYLRQAAADSTIAAPRSPAQPANHYKDRTVLCACSPSLSANMNATCRLGNDINDALASNVLYSA